MMPKNTLPFILAKAHQAFDISINNQSLKTLHALAPRINRPIIDSFYQFKAIFDEQKVVSSQCFKNKNIERQNSEYS
jgi:hypothetical protein